MKGENGQMACCRLYKAGRPRLSSSRTPFSSLVIARALRAPSSTAAYQMDNIKIKYQKAKGKVKDLLRPPSRQSTLTTPARSSRSSQEPVATLEHEITTTSTATVRVSQTAIAPAAITVPTADVPARDVSAPEPSPQPKQTQDSAATYAQPSSVTSKLATMASVCNDLFTVVHGASDAFPPLKSALGGILEIWKQCEVRYMLPRSSSLCSYCSFRGPLRLKTSS